MCDPTQVEKRRHQLFHLLQIRKSFALNGLNLGLHPDHIITVARQFLSNFSLESLNIALNFSELLQLLSLESERETAVSF
jgi:hypothetical protein